MAGRDLYRQCHRGDVLQVLVVLPLCLLALSACRPAPSTVRMTSPGNVLLALSDSCGSADLTGYIGRDYADLAGVNLPGDLRVVRPGEKVNGQISPSRLTVQVDAIGVVRRLFCG